MSRPKPLSPAEIDLAYTAAQRVVEVHHKLCAYVRAGMTLAQIDAEAGRILASLDCRSCFLNYKIGKGAPFPNHTCVSVNECVVHGTSLYHTEPLKPGDLFKIDVGVLHRGFIGDAAWTYAIGEATPEQKRLMQCGRESLKRGIPTLHPQNTWMTWARTIEECVERDYGYKCVGGLGGHGYGRTLHDKNLYVANSIPRNIQEWPDATRQCAPGTLVAVEPMIAIGTRDTYSGVEWMRLKGIPVPPSLKLLHEWPIISADGSLTVHYEADVLITDNGPRDLTEGMQQLPDVIG